MPKYCNVCSNTFVQENPPRQLKCCKYIACTNCVKWAADPNSLMSGSCPICMGTVASDLNVNSKEMTVAEAVQIDTDIIPIATLEEMQAKANYWYSNSIILDISPELFFDKYMSTLEAWKTWMKVEHVEWIDGRRRAEVVEEGAILCKDLGGYGNKMSEKILTLKRPDSSTNTSGVIALVVVRKNNELRNRRIYD